jgi:hypothetical protein
MAGKVTQGVAHPYPRSLRVGWDKPRSFDSGLPGWKKRRAPPPLTMASSGDGSDLRDRNCRSLAALGMTHGYVGQRAGRFLFPTLPAKYAGKGGPPTVMTIPAIPPINRICASHVYP